MKAIKIFSINRIIELDTGVLCKLHMDLYVLSEKKTIGEPIDFENLKLSWIFFELENPSKRILMDNHKPFGLHIHFDEDKQIPVDAKNIEDAQTFFFEAIKKHFGAEIEV